MRSFAITLLLLFPIVLLGAELESLPLASDEAKVIQRLIEREGEEVKLTPMRSPGNVTKMLEWLSDPEIKIGGLQAVQLTHPTKKGLVLQVTFDDQGRVVALTGNGPWIHNESLREFTGLPELRIIRVDHNSRHHQDPERGSNYTAEGFDALSDSKIAIVGLTSGTDDAGFAQILKLKNLRWMEIFHARVSEEALRGLAKHPTIQHLRIGKMGTVPASILEVVGSMPELRELRFNEAWVTYAGGLDYLKPLAGRLRLIDLTGSLITEADLAMAKADHPQVEIRTSTPEQVGKGHAGVAARLAKEDLPPELGEPLRKTISER